MIIQGIDTSHHQGAINWPKVRDAGYKFAFIKATEGVGWSDPSYKSNIEKATNVGILAGPYHYFRLHTPAEKQAEYFCSVVGPLGKGFLQPVLDLEEPGTLDIFKKNEGPQTVLNALDTFARVVRQNLGREITLYTFPYYWLNTLKNPKGYGKKYALWLAHYTTTPMLIGDWEFMTFWQHTASGKVPGVNGPVDLDKFIGNYDQLNKFAGL